MAGCLSGMVKYLLFFFNFLIVLCGIIFIALGSIAISHEGKGIKGLTESSAPAFAIALGVIIFIIAFLGCCGAIKEHSCMLTTYAVVLVLLLIIQIALGAISFVAVKNGNGEFDKGIRNVTEQFFNKYFSDNSNQELEKEVNQLQTWAQCCGIDGPRDFQGHNLAIPASCCAKAPCTEGNSYRGCAPVFAELFKSGFKVLGGVAIAFAIIELLCAIFACIVKNRN